MQKFIPVLCVVILFAPISAGAYLVFVQPAIHRDDSTFKRTENQHLDRSRTPKLVVDRVEHDFKVLPVSFTGTCQFNIRNEGTATLFLSSPPSRFGRVHIDLTRQSLDPNESCIAIASWTTGEIRETFDSTAIVLCNDPRRSTVQFRVHGKVEMELAASPSALTVPALSPQNETTVEALIHSHTWPQFAIARVNCTHPDVRCEIRPASGDQLAALQAQSGYWLSATFPPDLPHGYFKDQITIDAISEHDGKTKTLQIPLEGRVLRRLAVYGENIEFTGTVNVGVVRQGEQHSVRLLLKVRDDNPELKVTSIECIPNFLDVRVVPAAGSAGPEAGHYYLEISVPKTAPICDFTNTNGNELGKLRVQFDHPRISELELTLYLTVERKPR